MNRKNIQKLIAVLENLPDNQFNMTFPVDVHTRNDSSIKPHCGTTGCIAGWAVVAVSPDWFCPGGVMLRAEQVLELSKHQAACLFLPAVEDWYAVKRAHAITVLKHLLATGEVDWRVALPVLQQEG